MFSGYKDKNGKELNVGDLVFLKKDGIERELKVGFGEVERVVKNHTDFEASSCRVKISAFYFEWNGYKLFPIVDRNGVDDTSYMEKL